MSKKQNFPYLDRSLSSRGDSGPNLKSVENHRFKVDTLSSCIKKIRHRAQNSQSFKLPETLVSKVLIAVLYPDTEYTHTAATVDAEQRLIVIFATPHSTMFHDTHTDIHFMLS